MVFTSQKNHIMTRSCLHSSLRISWNSALTGIRTDAWQISMYSIHITIFPLTSELYVDWKISAFRHAHPVMHCTNRGTLGLQNNGWCLREIFWAENIRWQSGEQGAVPRNRIVNVCNINRHIIHVHEKVPNGHMAVIAVIILYQLAISWQGQRRQGQVHISGHDDLAFYSNIPGSYAYLTALERIHQIIQHKNTNRTGTLLL